MPDPYAPKGWPRSTASERVSPLDGFLARMRQLGATEEELAGVRDDWGNYDGEDWTPERKAQVLAATDDQLRAMLAEVRAEYEVGTVTEEEHAARARQHDYQLQLREAADRIGGTVADVLGWVGDDPVKAEAVLELEQGPDGADRKTLVEPLRQLADAGRVARPGQDVGSR